MSAVLDAGALDRRIAFLHFVRPPGPPKAGVGTWEAVAGASAVAAEVQELLPSRGERIADGLTIAQRPTRIRIRYRTDLTSGMRILYAGRTLQIMAPPIELGRREGLEIMAQDASTFGNDA